MIIYIVIVQWSLPNKNLSLNYIIFFKHSRYYFQILKILILALRL